MEFDGVDDSLNFPLSGPSPVQYYLFAVNTYVSAKKIHLLAVTHICTVFLLHSLLHLLDQILLGGVVHRVCCVAPRIYHLYNLRHFHRVYTRKFARQVAAGLPGTGSQIKMAIQLNIQFFGGTNNGTTSINTIALGEKGSDTGQNGNIIQLLHGIYIILC